MQNNKAPNIAPYINANCETIKHEDNYHLLKLLLPIQLFEGVAYNSSIAKLPTVHITVAKSFKYTMEIELCYLFEFGKSEKIVLRSYEDAKVAEIVYCTDVQQFIRLLGPKINPSVHLKTRMNLSIFLNKLLGFLLSSGYNHNHWNQVSSKN